jgi:hypothetical protein
MKSDATLIDLAIRESFKRHDGLVPGGMRETLVRAHKFLLSYEMSGYLADLTNAAFFESPDRSLALVDAARRQARLPFPVTWIEYDCRARKVRSHQAYAKSQYPTTGSLVTPDRIIPRIGWLLEQHPQIGTAFKMTEFVELDGTAARLPFSSTWVCDDQTVIPWPAMPWAGISSRERSEIATGVMGYVSDRISLTGIADGGILKETIGELRCALMLLATINDLPVTFDAVRPSKGYVARGQYRRFIEHSIIHLTVPEHRSLKTLAARALTNLRRRAHEVRGHFRIDWRHPPQALCQHDWQDAEHGALRCAICHGRKLHIRNHQRGDASVGFVMHDYEVERGTPEKTKLIEAQKTLAELAGKMGGVK